jgi:hypothetical protein
VRDVLRRLVSWWRRQQRVNAWQPGHSKLERFRRLDQELPVWEETETYRKLREVEDSNRADLVVRLRIEG